MSDDLDRKGIDVEAGGSEALREVTHCGVAQCSLGGRSVAMRILLINVCVYKKTSLRRYINYSSFQSFGISLVHEERVLVEGGEDDDVFRDRRPLRESFTIEK
jgi:hypothetical protein